MNPFSRQISGISNCFCTLAGANFKTTEIKLTLKTLNKIVIIGSGNVATHLAIALKESGKDIVQIYSRTTDNAKVLAEKVGAGYTSDTGKVAAGADLYIIAVSDDALKTVAGNIEFNSRLVVHTSGSAPLEILNRSSSNYGVFYPLQTFSKSRKVDFSNIPVCIEANSIENRELLKNLALSLTGNIHFIDSGKRKILHLAAVFTSNFPNFMYSIAHKISEDNSLDFDILKPLITETAAKVMDMTPEEAQTGPAMRGDEKIMKLHMEMLEKYPDFLNLYKTLSEGIKQGSDRAKE